MEHTRRSLFASLIALPVAAVAAVRGKAVYGRSRFEPPRTSPAFKCFNCGTLATSGLLPEGITIPGEYRTLGGAILCDPCILALRHCATCGCGINFVPRCHHSLESFNRPHGVPRLLHDGESLHWRSWQGLPVVTKEVVARTLLIAEADHQDLCGEYGGRDQIVADCPGCVSARARIGEIPDITRFGDGSLYITRNEERHLIGHIADITVDSSPTARIDSSKLLALLDADEARMAAFGKSL